MSQRTFRITSVLLLAACGAAGRTTNEPRRQTSGASLARGDSVQMSRKTRTKRPARKRTPPARPPRPVPLLRRHALALMCLLVVGLVVSGYLTYVHLRLHADPGWRSACDIDPQLSCDAVVLSSYGSIRGTPISIVGVWFYLVAIAVVVSALRGSGWGFPRSPAVVLFVGAAVATAFSVFLATISIAWLGALCPLCVIVYAINIAVTATAWHAIRRSGESVAGAVRLERAHWRTNRALAVTLSLAVMAILGAGVVIYSNSRSSRVRVMPCRERRTADGLTTFSGGPSCADSVRRFSAPTSPFCQDRGRDAPPSRPIGAALPATGGWGQGSRSDGRRPRGLDAAAWRWLRRSATASLRTSAFIAADHVTRKREAPEFAGRVVGLRRGCQGRSVGSIHRVCYLHRFSVSSLSKGRRSPSPDSPAAARRNSRRDASLPAGCYVQSTGEAFAASGILPARARFDLRRCTG